MDDLRTRLAAALAAADGKAYPGDTPDWEELADAVLATMLTGLDGLYARLRDAEDARKAAVGLLEKQNLELVRLKVTLARVWALIERGVADDVIDDEDAAEANGYRCALSDVRGALDA